MAKTLIIKGANYASNMLAHVTFHSVPCTGISFSSDSFTVNDYDPVEVEYSLTPEDTTDSVLWESSDSDVVTIENAIMTIVGLGTATITATCGEQTATATVTVEITCTPKWEWSAVSVADSIATYTAGANVNQLGAFGFGDQASENVLLPTNANRVDYPYAIKLPKNTARVKISATNQSIFRNGDYSRFAWTKDEPSGASGQPGNAIKGISVEYVNLYTGPAVKSVPAGADCVNIMCRIEGDQTGYALNPDGYAADKGIKIEFLTAE